MLCTPPKHDRAHHMGAIGHRGQYHHQRSAICASTGPNDTTIFTCCWPDFDDTTELKQNAPRSETAEKRLGDTLTGVIACLFPSQDAKCPS